jgi:hypothetical protein
MSTSRMIILRIFIIVMWDYVFNVLYGARISSILAISNLGRTKLGIDIDAGILEECGRQDPPCTDDDRIIV